MADAPFCCSSRHLELRITSHLDIEPLSPAASRHVSDVQLVPCGTFDLRAHVQSECVRSSPAGSPSAVLSGGMFVRRALMLVLVLGILGQDGHPDNDLSNMSHGDATVFWVRVKRAVAPHVPLTGSVIPGGLSRPP